MPGPLVQFGAQVICLHGGQANATAVNPRVMLSGAPAVMITAPMVVAGCALPPPPAANGPCVTGQWLSGSVRVLSDGQPFVVQTSASLCAPTATPLTVIAAQTRVIGQ